MSDFNQDMKEATDRFKAWGEKASIFDSDFAAIDGLLQRHYDQRSELFVKMLDRLEPSNAQVADEWERICDTGLERLESLNSAVSSRAADGLRGIGLGSFYEGEKKIWQENRKANIADTAETITAIGKTDEQMIDDLQRQFKEARGSVEQATEQWRQALGNHYESVKELSTTVGENLIDLAVSKADEKLIGPLKKIIPGAEKLVGKGADTMHERREFSKKVAAYKKIILDNMQELDKLKSRLSADVIETMRSDCEKYASSLKDGGTGEYHALDWAVFGDECSRKLRSRSERASEKAKFLYQDVFPLYKEGVSKSLADLVWQNSALVRLRAQMDDESLLIFEKLRKDDEILAAVHNNDEKGRAVAMLRDIQQKIGDRIKELKQIMDEADEDDRS